MATYRGYVKAYSDDLWLVAEYMTEEAESWDEAVEKMQRKVEARCPAANSIIIGEA